MRNQNRLNLNTPKPPRTLSGPSKTLWLTVQSQFGIDDAGGLAVLSAACEAHQRVRQAQVILKDEGLLVRDARGQIRPHPAVKIEVDSRAQFLAAVKQLNLDLEPLEHSVGRPGGGAKGKLQLLQVK